MQANINSIQTLVANTYRLRFNAEPIVVSSPGRINLIGEHTDYNNGFVLPAAIDHATFIALGKSADKQSCFIALDMNDECVIGVNQIDKQERHWSDYLKGVIVELQQSGYIIDDFNCVISGDVPFGAGMSSSAALECALIFGLNELFELQLNKITMIKLAQKAENNFVGVKSGIMDQFTSMMGKKGYVIKLDCRSLDFEYIPFDPSGVAVVLFDTAIKHSLASSEYNTRRAECEAGVEIIRSAYPAVKSLRDVTVNMIDECLLPGTKMYDRCKYVVEENERLLQGCMDLGKNDLLGFGKKMYQTHDGLSKLYEVSCAELDFLVEFVKNEPAVFGARMMGGGFGGCTINLIEYDAVDVLYKRLEQAYRNTFNLELQQYVVGIDNGSVRWI